MNRLFLAAAALVFTAGPAFAQSQDVAPRGTGPLLDYSAYKPAPVTDAQRLVLLYDNGPIQTGTGDGAGGANTSAIQTSYGSTLFGSGHALATTSVADDFTVPAGGWTISDIDFFSYQTGGNPTTSTFTGVYAQIWNGRPGDAGSTVVFGDLTTNRLASSTFSGIYRVTETTLTNAQRPVWRNRATIGTTLAAGTYWVQWASTGSLASGPWVPPVTLAGSPTPPVGNARQFTISTSTWADALDGTIVVALPFVVNGTAGTPVGPVLSASPTTLPFGDVVQGGTSAAQTVTLTNSGSSTLTIASITGSGAPFAVNTTGTSLSLAAGASTTFSVTFAPTAVGPATGSVVITSNAPSSPTTIALSGNGTSATPPVVTSFCSGTLTNVPGGQPATTVGPFNPYPNTITVSGITRPVVDVNVRLVGMDHTFPDDLDIFVEHPLGPTAILMSDAGGATALVGATLTFDDEAAAVVPDATAGAIATGSYRPADYVAGDVYPAPAPAPSGTSLAAFDGASPNGAWKLYGNDDASGDVGVITDVCLDISTTNPVAGEGSPTARTFLTAAPNPAHSGARVRFAAETAQDVTVAVFDVTGRQVATLFSGAVAADQTLDLRLDAAALPSGVYVVRATGASVNLTQRVTVVR